MTQTWDPDVYLRYEQYRARPALDLIAQIPLEVKGNIVDLGCGPGNITRTLKETWPDRKVTGVDKSESMLDKARNANADADVAWQNGDISSWQPEERVALIFSNAALHWVPNHAEVIQRLPTHLVPGGWCALQIPVTEHCPYQICIRETVNSDRWAAKLADVWMYKDPIGPEPLYDLLSPNCQAVDIWVTDYHHVLEGVNPVFDWIIGTGLTPYLTVLDETDRADFLEDYGARVAAAYPKQADGKTLFLMTRIFVLAQAS